MTGPHGPFHLSTPRNEDSDAPNFALTSPEQNAILNYMQSCMHYLGANRAVFSSGRRCTLAKGPNHHKQSSILPFLLGLTALLLLCPSAGHGEELQISAAASLTEAFNELGSAFVAEHPGTQMVFNFAGSQLLRSQIESGAPADIFASANQKTMAGLLKQNLVSSPVIFAGNRLVLIVNKAAASTVPDFAAAAKPGRLLAVGTKEVPIGAYTRQLLDQLASDPAFGPDFVARFRRNIVTQETNVKAVVVKVALGEVDAGIVYQTDLTSAMAHELVTRPLPPGHNPKAFYPIAVVQNASHPTLAESFFHFVLSPAGQQILQRHGFLTTGDSP
jgi:molybdate transport system substrate-binding protein